MFGCIVAGRPVTTTLTQLSPTHAYFSLPSASSINHITLFLTGAVPFPPGYGATVHFYWPGRGFQLLGMLSNDKPSAVFRVRGAAGGFSVGSGTGSQGVFGGVGGGGGMGGMGGMGGGMDAGMNGEEQEDVTAILGLAIEPLEAIAAQLPQGSSSPGGASSSTALVKPPSVADTALLAERIVKHLINYVSGFSGGGGGEVLVPMGTIMKWYESFIGKIKTTGGVSFLENVE